MIESPARDGASTADAQAVTASFAPAAPDETAAMAEPRDLSYLHDIELTLTVELGRTMLPVREVLKLRRGTVVELDKLVGQPANLLINNVLMAKGEVVVVNERFGLRITKFMNAGEK